MICLGLWSRLDRFRLYLGYSRLGLWFILDRIRRRFLLFRQYCGIYGRRFIDLDRFGCCGCFLRRRLSGLSFRDCSLGAAAHAKL